ncbi:N-acetylmuramic acid 6-phosphate etherase [uncultured Megasphaera sp.]|uniref:N-acetylmuramic acid 6-phosphate etherase n=1 Tax=uncultured Megasphaera sp. TaxID=165188 RepID=UPI0025E272A1|nr:N-acetylmuramic acid 6-phosphate etherase [uncultured Megasphaera sp.]
MIELESLATEQRNSCSQHIDRLPTEAMVSLINDEDHKVAEAIKGIVPDIARAVDVIADRLRQGGRLFYMGAGTSGRLGILDAVECPPTYSTDPDQIQGLIAGGYDAIFRAKEGAEDSPDLGRDDLIEKGLTAGDIVVGLSASGRTPYVVGGLTYANSVGAATIAIDCSPNSPIGACAAIDLCAVVGPEVVTGSTRMKAGTAQKMIANMLSTGAMIRLGKVYGNLMVDVKSSNKKLEERARRIVMTATGCSRQDAVEALTESGGRAKTAIVMVLLGLSAKEADAKLAAARGYVAAVIQEADHGLR